MSPRIPAVDGPTAAEILWPTFSRGQIPGVVFNADTHTVAVIPLSQKDPQELSDAIWLYQMLERGLLVVA